MKPKLYEPNDTSFGKNELNQTNQNYLQLNYQFKFRYLNENVQETEKATMDLPIDLSIKRASPENSLKVLNEQKEIDKQDVNRKENKNDHHLKDQLNDLNKNEAKLLPYLLMSSQVTNLTKTSARLNENVNEEPSSTFHSDADLLKYNKKKFFLASIRKQSSSSTDNSNLSSNSTNFSSSSSTSSNSPNSTPLHITHQPIKSDRRNSSSSTSSTNLTLSPINNHSNNHDLNSQSSIKEVDNLYSNGLKDKLFENGLYHMPNSFNKKFEYLSKHYKLKENGNLDNSKLINGNNESNDNHDLSKSINGKLPNGKYLNGINGSNGLNNSNISNDSTTRVQTYLKCIEKSHIQKCNKPTYIGLKRTLSESYLMDQKQENYFNLLTYKRKQMRKCGSESDLADLIRSYRCNDKQLIKKNSHLNGHFNSNKELKTNDKELVSKKPKQQQSINNNSSKRSQFINDPVSGYRDTDLKQNYNNHHNDLYETELKRQLIDKQQKEQFYLKNQTKEEELMNYTKQSIRNQKNIYQFNHLNHHFDEFDKFCQLKSNSLPLNLQLNRTKTSLAFNNSQLFNTKSLINGQNKLNEKTGGKRKFTKLASDEDEEDLEDEDENEENIIVDHLSNTASSSVSVSPSSIQSNSDSSLINKQLLSKHHPLNIGQLNNHHHLSLDRHHPDSSLDLRLPFLNHPSHLNSHLNRRTVQAKQNFGNLPDLLPADLLPGPESASGLNPNLVSKDNLTSSWKFYKDYYYLLLNQPDSPAKLNALQWIMKDLNEKNNNHLGVDEWSDSELVKLNAYKQSYPLDNNCPINMSMFNNLNRSMNSSLIDQTHRQLLGTSRLEKFSSNSPPQPMNLTNLQLTPENYLQYVKMNESYLNGNRLNGQQQLQILTGQSYLNLDNGSNHCLPPGTPNSFQGNFWS